MKAHPKGESGISYWTSPAVERKMKKLEKVLEKVLTKGGRCGIIGRSTREWHVDEMIFEN
jgi:hypothetical protein